MESGGGDDMLEVRHMEDGPEESVDTEHNILHTSPRPIFSWELLNFVVRHNTVNVSTEYGGKHMPRWRLTLNMFSFFSILLLVKTSSQRAFHNRNIYQIKWDTRLWNKENNWDNHFVRGWLKPRLAMNQTNGPLLGHINKNGPYCEREKKEKTIQQNRLMKTATYSLKFYYRLEMF